VPDASYTVGIAEIVLVVRDVPAAARFYRDVVGLAPDGEPSERWAWFFTGGEGRAKRLAMAKGPLLFEEHSPRPEGERWGPVHFALHVPADRLEQAIEDVRAHGVEIHGPVHFDWMRASGYYFYDPDGNLVEFWSPDPE
jgi:catechol 2,3-dioxygenase-like lactoylglutathione lyase family enzyme